MGKKYVLYLNVGNKLELQGETFTTSSVYMSTESFYKSMMRNKVTQELLEPGDRLLILTTDGETHIEVLP